MKIINLTPHDLNIVNKNGDIIKIEKSGIVARVSSNKENIGEENNFIITRETFGDVIDLPTPQKDTLFVVSRLVAQACSNREDLLVPGELIRDEKGNPIGAKGFSKI